MFSLCNGTIQRGRWVQKISSVLISISALCYFKHASVLGFHTWSLNPHCDLNLLKSAQAPTLKIKVHTSGLWSAWRMATLWRSDLMLGFWEFFSPRLSTGNHDSANADTDSPTQPYCTPARAMWTNPNQDFSSNPFIISYTIHSCAQRKPEKTGGHIGCHGTKPYTRCSRRQSEVLCI